MNEDPTIPSPSEGAADIEARLRDALASRAGAAPVKPADWGAFAGRLATTTRRRQRVLVGVAGVALFVGAAGGYFGEAAASTGPLATRSTTSGTTPSTTIAPGRAGSLAPSPGGAAVMCPNISGGSPGTSSGAASSDIGSATRLFVRTTTDGVTIRVYENAQTGVSCLETPNPASGSGSGSSPGSTGSSGSAGSAASPTTTVAPGSELMPLVPSGRDTTVELSDDDAVGQGAMSAPQCVMSPAGGTTGGSGSGAVAGGQPGSSPASPPQGANAPVTTPTPTDPVTTIPVTTIPVTTTTTTTATGSGDQPQELTSGTFGVTEGDPVWWVAVDVGSDVTSVQMTFPDGGTDQMAPVNGVAVLAHRVPPAVASADSGPYVVRGSLQLLSGGSVVGTVTLPQEPSPVPGPLPEPVPFNQGAQAVSPGVIMVCPPSTTVTPPSQSSGPTENR